MKLGGLVLARRILDYDGLETCSERMAYQARVAAEMEAAHAGELRIIKEKIISQ